MKTLRILALLATLSCAAMAEGKIDASDTTASVLKKQVGQKVELHLKSGEKIAGKLEVVGEKAVQVTALTGMDLFEAVVDIDQISAVVYRTAK